MTNAFRAPRQVFGRTIPIAGLMILFLVPWLHAGQAPPSDLDGLMAKVLMRRKVNQEVLKDYVLNDMEQFEAVAPGDSVLVRNKNEYIWYVRDGIHVRSPLRSNGVTISKEERKEYEDNWIKKEQEAAKRRAESKAKKANAAGAAAEDETPPDPSKPSVVAALAEPRFVSEAYFLDFKFESGTYYLVRKDEFEGRDVLVIEYYPTNLFNDDDDKSDGPDEQKDKKPQKPPSKKEQERDAQINRQMNKTSLVTLWVDPAEFQIVKYEFNNVWMDFLPMAWMLRVDQLKASMEMSQPIPGVWLPRNMSIQAGVSLAVGQFKAKYERRFSDYRRAEVTTTLRPADRE